MSQLPRTSLEFALKANNKHNNRYDYSSVVYINGKTKIDIICSDHGVFSQSPIAHVSGAGCPKCKGEKLSLLKRMSNNTFVEKARKVHGDRYEYSKINYINYTTKIEIVCQKHGVFWQNPDNHLNLSQGCPKCSAIISKIEIRWLDSLKVPEDYRQKTLFIGERKIRTDAYDPVTNTIYEFYGDYWHGNLNRFDANEINQSNKKTFGKLHKETQVKRQIILDAGYNLVEKWEQDFKKETL